LTEAAEILFEDRGNERYGKSLEAFGLVNNASGIFCREESEALLR
jgi:hypothetical protein